MDVFLLRYINKDRKIFPAVGFAFRIVKDNIAISYTFVTLHQTLPMI